MSEDGHGQGEMHLGRNPDGKICFGAGPVRLRFTQAEALGLWQKLGVLLLDADVPCGCEPAPAQPGKRSSGNTGPDDWFGF